MYRQRIEEALIYSQGALDCVGVLAKGDGHCLRTPPCRHTRMAPQSTLGIDQRFLSLLTALFIACSAFAPTAANSQEGEPIRLDADEAEIDNASGISVYTGNVVMTQGLREITGDRMTVHTARGGRELSRVIVDGNPAIYTQEPDGEDPLVRAEAPRMEYYASGPERIILLDGGTVTRGRNTFTGETIHYDLESEVVNAEGDRDRGRRIRMTLFPEDDE